MVRYGQLKISGVLCLIVWFVAGCAAVSEQGRKQDSDYEQLKLRINPQIQTLGLNCDEMSRITKTLDTATKSELYGSDEQLNYMQKAQLYAVKTQKTSCCQWYTMSLVDSIRPEMRKDYLTHQVEALKDALSENTYDLMSLNTYEAFIEDQHTLSDIRKVADLVRRNNDIIEKLIRYLTPFANPEPVSRDTLSIE